MLYVIDESEVKSIDFYLMNNIFGRENKRIILNT